MSRKVLFITKYYYPHIGGVERHVEEVSKEFIKKVHKIAIITEKYDSKLTDQETQDGIRIYRFSYPKIKFLGLITIWLKLFSYFKLFITSDIIHIHDVAIWYLPVRLILFWKPIILTVHGWEGSYPIPLKNILLKRLSVLISSKTICVGKYIEKYYGIRADKIIYGGVNLTRFRIKKNPKLIIYLGRLGKDTGLKTFLRAAKKLKDYKIEFCGDGPLIDECKKVGGVHGFVDPHPYLAKASICFASGYLSVLEALAYKCQVIVVYDNPLRKDMFLNSPFKKYIFLCKSRFEVQRAIKSKKKSKYKNIPSWMAIANTYQEVYNCVI